MKTTAANINQLWANMIVEELVRFGVTGFVLSPGSRCTPLTVAAAGSGVDTVVHFDERGAAFYALGHARATGKPAALICTSGTATANYYPAIVEASMDTVPMILLTADRPAGLRGTGANQTIDQVKMYGRYARYFHDLPCPDKKHPAETVLRAVGEAFNYSTGSPCGPVHLNCQFEEPLAPLGDDEDFGSYLSGVAGWCESGDVFSSTPDNRSEPGGVDDTASILNQAPNGLIVVGALRNEREVEAVGGLAEKIGWPLLADIRSGLRLGNRCANVIEYFDQLLLSDKVQGMKPSAVLHLGGMVTSKRYNQWIRRCRCENYVLVADHPFPHDPGGVVTKKVQSDVGEFCRHLEARIKRNYGGEWMDALCEYNAVAGKTIETAIGNDSTLSEQAVARLVSGHIPKGHGLFLASSMPIRDMDMYADANGHTVRVTANRGASGIDGTLASAVGWAEGLNSPVTLIVGDLAFLHDLNSMMLVRGSRNPVTVVVINNDGGGIFSFLPVNECREVFEPYFATPHGMSFEKIAGAFGIGHFRSGAKDGFVDVYKNAVSSGRSSIIEVKTDREENRSSHQELQQRITREIETCETHG